MSTAHPGAPGDLLLILGTIRLPPTSLRAALPAMAEMVAASRAEPGCLDYVYAEDLLDRGLIHVKEVWSGRAELDAHFASDHLARWRAAWPSLGISDRALSLYELGEPRPI